MPISVTCPGCSKVIKVPEQYAGKSGKCPGCGAKIAIPAGDAPQAAPPKSAASPAVAAKPVVAKPITAKPLPQPAASQPAAPQPAAAQGFNPQAFNFSTAPAQKATPAAAPEPAAASVPEAGAFNFTTTKAKKPAAAPAPVAVAPATPNPNPYVSPAAVGDPVPGGETLQDAGVGRRLVNYLIDYVAVMVLAIAFGVGIVMMMIPSDGRRPQPGAADTAVMLSMVVGFTMPFWYSFLLEMVCQKTLGKMVTGTKVVRMDGSRPSPFQFIGRALARYIPFEPFSFIGSPHPRGWHDRLSGTRVVRQ